jgi:LPS export ABC transporter protein LptC
MMRYFCLAFVVSLVFACTPKDEEINELFSADLNENLRIGKNIRIVYSDSAVIRLVVNAPEMLQYQSQNNYTKDVFPKGVLLEFMGPNNTVNSWLKAETAIRESRTQKITAKGNVVFYDSKNQKLETPELIYDQNTRIVYTDKLVRISQAEKGDTTYGFGFKANESFSIFEIKKKVQGKRNVADFVTEFK